MHVFNLTEFLLIITWFVKLLLQYQTSQSRYDHDIFNFVYCVLSFSVENLRHNCKESAQKNNHKTNIVVYVVIIFKRSKKKMLIVA